MILTAQTLHVDLLRLLTLIDRIMFLSNGTNLLYINIEILNGDVGGD
jgi:hypothetical protein